MFASAVDGVIGTQGIEHTAQQTVYLELCGFEFQDPKTRELLEGTRDNDTTKVSMVIDLPFFQGLATFLT